MIIHPLAGVIGSLVPRGIILSLSGLDVTGNKSVDPSYAGITFKPDGTEWSTPIGGDSNFTKARGSWIDRGDPTGVWIQWTRDGGTLGDWNSLDAGDAIVQLDLERSWRIVNTAPINKTITGTFDFYDSSVDGNLLASTGILTFTAEWESGA